MNNQRKDTLFQMNKIANNYFFQGNNRYDYGFSFLFFTNFSK